MKEKKVVAIVQARMGSSRFPGKPMKKIIGRPMIEHVYQRVKMSSFLDEVYVATCDDDIFTFIKSIGGKVVMTSDLHERCTERTAEAIEKIEKELKKKFEIIVMVQGDEPMVTPEMIDVSIKTFKNSKGIKVQVCSPGFVETAATSVNDFYMPGLLKADKAARLIYKYMHSRKFEFTFPLGFSLFMRVLSVLPDKISSYLINKIK